MLKKETHILQQVTSDSLNEGLPIKMARKKKFKENDRFSIKKIVGSPLESSAKVFFLIGLVPI